jgi:hypothetical protein
MDRGIIDAFNNLANPDPYVLPRCPADTPFGIQFGNRAPCDLCQVQGKSVIFDCKACTLRICERCHTDQLNNHTTHESSGRKAMMDYAAARRAAMQERQRMFVAYHEANPPLRPPGLRQNPPKRKL